MRKINPKERSNGMKYCTFCKPAKVAAIYRNTGLTTDQHIEFACEEHKHLLVDGKFTLAYYKEQEKRDSCRKETDDISEGERQAMQMFGI